MGRLEGQVAIVTGGGTGIGRGLARALANEGAHVVICGRRLEPLENTLQNIRDAGGSASAVQANVADRNDVSRVIENTLKAYGAIDILINNAGIGGGSQIHEHDVDTWRSVLDVNLTGPFLMARAVLPTMRSQKRGQIINISSEAGIEYYPGDGAYGVAKHALNALGEYIQRENQDFNIRVNTVCPGMVITEMTQGRQGLDPAKCLYPEDIADLVVWLLTRRDNVKLGLPVLIQTMENPWR